MDTTPQEIASCIPDLSHVEQVFPAGNKIESVYDKLTPIAREYPHTWGEHYASNLFFKGGYLPTERITLEGLTEDNYLNILKWVRAALGSFYPKHEDKERVCGMLLEMFFKEPS